MRKTLRCSLAGCARAGSLLLALTAPAAPLQADPFPPTWTELADCGTPGNACHFAPVSWPAEPVDPADCGAACGEWLPYTRFQGSVNDPKTQDPSNGGTRPQNYVNISSSCSDRSQPSIYYALLRGAAADGSQDVIAFRWRVEQIAHTYGTGPSPGTARSTDPWSSALWTVLFDLDGDGIRDVAAHLDGSSGAPATSVDVLAGIWGDVPTQSIDYLDDPSIHRIAHNPTAFVDDGTGRILGFRSGVPATATWPNGAAETVWDYGTTRARLVSTSPCNEYFIDYQIPVALLDASPLGGPKIDRTTPLAMLFCTANSLNDPFQKDCAIDKAWASSPSRSAPFGDFASFDLGGFAQPIVDEIRAEGCGVFDLAAKVKDTIAIVAGEAERTLQAVDFYAYRDDDGDGQADDGNAWFPAATGSPDAGALNAWSATWDARSLLNGQYLLGVQAMDDPDPSLLDDGMTSDGVAHRTYSYLTEAEVKALGAPPSGERWYANPAATGVQSLAVAVNACGRPTPFVEKTAAATSGTVGEVVAYTVTVHNTLDTALAVSEVTDHLPAGFRFVGTDGGTLSPTGGPVGGAAGELTWTFSPAASIPAGGTGALTFRVELPAVTGTYQNWASAVTGFAANPLESEPVAIAVGEARLSLAKTASPLAALPGDTVAFEIAYANDSPVDVTGAVLTDALPDGLSYVPASATEPASFDAGTGTLTWNLGALPSGGRGTVSFSATVDDPFPATATVPLVNTAAIASSQTAPATDTAALAVDVPQPRLTLEKSADTALVAPGGTVTFTLRYANTGGAPASGVVVSDTMPAGFTFVSASPGAVPDGGVVAWNLGTLAAGTSGTTTLTLQANDPFPAVNPAVNRATVASDQCAPVETELSVGVVQTGQVCQAFYFRDETGDVGAAVSARLATETPVPQAADTGAGVTVTVPGGAGNFVEAGRFYQEPAAPGEVTFSGDLTTRLYIDRQAGAGITLRGTVLDHDSGTGATVQLGQGSGSFQGSHTGLFEFTVPLAGTLQKGHRLLWVFEASSNNNQSTDLLLQFDGTVTDSVSGSGTTFADSHAAFCVTPPARVVLQKTADVSSVAAGETFTYTLDFANLGETAATGSVITDTLPAGLSFDAATLNGATVTPVVSGADHSFTVSSTGAPAGEIAGGAAGSLQITVTADDPLEAGLHQLVNAASLASDQTQPVTAGTATPVEGAAAPGEPHLVLDKTVSAGTLRPGDTATYTLTVLNAGTADATGVTVTDDLPDTAYFAYAAGTIAGGDARSDGDPGRLEWTLTTLAPGASRTLTFDMRVATSGVPSGVTFLDNRAEATRDGSADVAASGPASVAVRATPALRLAKTAEAPPAGGSWQPGDRFGYTLTVENTGNTEALGVVVTDPVPAGTSFEAVTAGAGTFEPDRNRVRFDVGSLAPGAAAALGFRVRVGDASVAGEAAIENHAAASASNAATAEAAATGLALGVPVLELTKTGPEVLPLPAARLTVAADAATSVAVDGSGLLELGQTVRIDGQAAVVVDLGASTIALDRPVTAAAGSPVERAAVYTLGYRNSGTGTASGARLVDDLPGTLAFHAASPPPAGAAGGTLTWDLGDLAPGDGGTVEVTAFPTAPGLVANTATLAADGLAEVAAAADTAVGGLRVRKWTTTPVAAAGGTATWTLEVANTLAAPVHGVTVRDLLPPGFLYRAGSTSVSGASDRGPVVEPSGGDAFPTWGDFEIAGGAALTLTFRADVASTAGAAVYQNAVEVTADDASPLPFDPLATTAEDVTVLAAGSSLVEGHAYRDVNGDGAFDAGDAPLAGIEVAIVDGAGAWFVAPTDGSGYFRRVVPAGSVSVDVGGEGDVGVPAGLALAPGSTDPAFVTAPAGGAVRHDVGYGTEGGTGGPAELLDVPVSGTAGKILLALLLAAAGLWAVRFR